MKVLFRTERVPAISKDVGQGQFEGIAWCELVLHETPPDEKTWEGGGRTVAYWRDQFARTRDPHRWIVPAAAMVGVAPAVIPDDVVSSLPEDARISFLWNFVRSRAEGASA
jgi:hypothetical protein